ncbi:AAA family ATPase [Pseudomonas sp. VS38]|uniref:AAA family ATPase n=1 Tax=Pseudomonas sp. VS38 TaxID=2834066 RepID=UPI001BDEBF5C|nr:AAA family ATPase [Pseudomonas sp. VS38]MBT1267526.1 AAA family ATPase [Pseudomonas sp. VS38]
MEFSPYLIIRKVLIKGITSNYEADFREGLNIIWGDMDCGKSSILNLIDYCLGGRNTSLLYEELSAKGRTALLEVDLNGTVCTFERSISDEQGAIRVFMCGISDASGTFPMLMSGFPSQSMPDGWVSDFILDSLGIAKVSIKESRIRDDSSSDRLSFRDLMKLLYLKQTKVGADSLLNFGNAPLFNKNVEIQKFVFNIHDDKLAALTQDLASEASDLNKLKSNQLAVSKFLADVKISMLGMSINEKLQVVEDDLETLCESGESLKSDYQFATDLALSMAGEISSLKSQLSEKNRNLEENLRKYKSFSSLKSTYLNDLECLKISKITRESISLKKLKDHKLSCPLCRSEVSLSTEYLDDEVIDSEIKSIRNRASGVQAMLDGIWDQNQNLERDANKITEVLGGVSVKFDTLNIENISALLKSIEAVERQKVELRVMISEFKRDISINNKYDDLAKKIESKESVVGRLKLSIKIAQDALVGLEDIVKSISRIFNSYIKNSGLQNVRDVYIDQKFIPHFRNMSYYNHSSGGVRTITSILSFAARLKFLLKQPGNLPTFLMVDTPGQNIGRNVRDDEESEFSDPVVYDKIFKRFSSICKYAKDSNRKCQIIVVDNDLPKFLKEGENFHLVKRFSKHSEKFEKGLVNDY